MLIREIRDDIADIKTKQGKVVAWVSGLVSSLLVGGLIGFLFQK